LLECVTVASARTDNVYCQTKPTWQSLQNRRIAGARR
jgi:hypothetical protein